MMLRTKFNKVSTHVVISTPKKLVQEASTARHATQTDDLFVFDREMIIVSDLVAFIDHLFRIDYYLLAIANREDSCSTVRGAAMVYQAAKIALHGRIDDYVVVNTATHRYVSQACNSRISCTLYTHKR